MSIGYSHKRFLDCSCSDCDDHRRKDQRRLWMVLLDGDMIQPGDHYSSSLSGGLYRCTPDMMGKQVPAMGMPHLRPAGVA